MLLSQSALGLGLEATSLGEKSFSADCLCAARTWSWARSQELGGPLMCFQTLVFNEHPTVAVPLL